MFLSQNLQVIAAAATGEKTASDPVAIFTIVPRPPTLIRPTRKKGVLHVKTSGVILRMIITFSGSDGMSFATPDDMVVDV